MMTEEQLYEAAVALRVATDRLIGAVLEMPPTIEICVFTGKLSGALDILIALEAAGAPIHDPNEQPHPLKRG